MSFDLNILNPQQKEAVVNTEGPCMIIAGAGSGKTRVLTYKIAYLVESGVSPFEILALTFTNKAAKEMRERISRISPESADKLWMGTFHSIFARILRIDGHRIGFDRNFTIYDSDDSLSVIKQAMNLNNISTDSVNPKSIQSSISKLKNRFITPSNFSAKNKNDFEKKVSFVYNEYQEILKKNNSMDFDDLLVKPIELFNMNPDILEKYQERFKFTLVDEYQDTNRAQYILIRALSQKYKNLSIVGDDAQSIYKWRGAEIQNIFDFETDYSERKIFRLEQNYRSTKKILELADDVIKKNKKQIEKNLWTENDEGESIFLVENMTDREEGLKTAKYILDEIQKEKYNFKDFVVLYRTNAQSRALEDALRMQKIPYVIIGGIRFYQRKEIKDLLAYFKIVVNHSDSEALLRILGLTEGIGKTTTDKLKEISNSSGISIYEVLKSISEYSEFSGKLKTRLYDLYKFIEKYSYLLDEMKLTELTRGILDETGVIRELKNENTLESEERISNIQELISAIAEYDDSLENAKLEGFLQEVSLVADIDTIDNQKNAVTLMTIHAAKGLEFPVVFITGLEEGLFPGNNALIQEEELEEERRLFYVAITRAMKKLYIMYANQRYKFGTPSYQARSRFIKEISPLIFDKHIKYEGLKTFNTGSNGSRAKQGRSIQYDFTGFNNKKKVEEEFDNDKFPDIRKGVTVSHETFGKGTVLGIHGKGLDKRAEIYFEDIGLKKIVLKYAKLTINNIE
ncbi:MAG TPA: UvrD-helicase domain-containing protein [Ignavibacteria bacterium]|nr:UvrD-helicase domain-containing protein [Ignavibacteria bacterium]